MTKLSITKAALLLMIALIAGGCNYATHQTISKSNTDEEDPEPVYEITLDDDYQNFVSYMYMGNRSLNFSTFFNVYYTATDNFSNVLEEYRTNTIAAYNRRLDSLNINTSLSAEGKEKLNEVIKGASKVIQFKKSSRFIDDAVLLIGKSYYYLNDYLQAERKFNEFLSKLNMSPLKDEAILYLGKTKMKLGTTQEAETLLTNLIKNTTDDNIKSEAAQELAINAVRKKDYDSAIKYFEESIKYATDSEGKAQRQYILAKIYSISKPTQSAGQYKKAMDLSSDFDLSFFSKLNYAKSLIIIKDYTQAARLLSELESKYREYPEYKQLAELEVANNLYAQGKYKNALKKYYEVIVEYPATATASDAYYFIAKYYEDKENDYLNALVNYTKVNEESAASDFSLLSHKKSDTFNRYFTLEAAINETEKREIPKENLSVESFRREFNEENNLENNKSGNNGNNNNPGNEEEGAKGMKGRGYPPVDVNVMDSLEGDDGTLEENLNQENFNIDETKTGDTLNPTGDTLNPTLQTEIPVDTLTGTRDPKFEAYFEMAELFYYSLGRADSAEYYLNRILSLYEEPEQVSKVLYALGNIYKNTGKTSEANGIFNKIVSEYPETIFANESRKLLGMAVTIAEEDAAEVLFREASTDIFNKDYGAARTKLETIVTQHPESSYIPNSLYSLGWMYENIYNSNDSAVLYYGRLKDGFPQTEFYARVSGKLDALATQNGTNTNVPVNNETPPEEMKTVEAPEKIEENNEQIPPNLMEELEKQNETNGNEDGDKKNEGDDGRR